MQMSAARHSSTISVEVTDTLLSPGSTSSALAVATCTRDVVAGGICDESGNSASTIDFGTSEPAGVSVMTASFTASAAVDTSAASTGVLAIAVACGASAISGSGLRDGALRSTIGALPVFSMLAEPSPPNQATTQPARRAAAATVANRREFIIQASKGSTRAECRAKHVMPLIFRLMIWTLNGGSC